MFLDAATDAGKVAISKLLLDLPHGIGHELLRRNPGNTTLKGELLYACQTIELHQVRLRLAANLRQARQFCLELATAAPQHRVESRS